MKQIRCALVAAMVLLATGAAEANWEVRIPYLPDDAMIVITSYSERATGIYYGPVCVDGSVADYSRIAVPSYGMRTLFKSDITGVNGEFWLWLWASYEFGVVVVSTEGCSAYYPGRAYGETEGE
jgi:hypothetical protein